MRRVDAPIRAEHALPDGTEVIVRSVRPTDKPLLIRGFRELSEHSRYRRFLHFKTDLTTEELRRFTEVDGTDHFAIGVVQPDADGSEVPMAIGRLVRLDTSERIGEIAIVVIDAFQGRGLGSLLMRYLIDAARDRGMDRVHFTLLADNDPMRRLIRSVFGETRTVDRDGPIITVEAEVPESVEHPMVHLRRAHGLAWLSQLGATRRINRALNRLTSGDTAS